MKTFFTLAMILLSWNAWSQLDSIYYHDYSFESQYGASGAYPSTDYMQMITRFTPASYPAQLSGIRVWLRNATSPAPLRIIVRSDSSASSNANNSSQVYISANPIQNPSSNGQPDSAYSIYVDLTQYNLYFNSGDVYAGITQNLQLNGFVGYALDTNNQSLYDRHWISTNQGAAGSWMQFVSWSFIPSQLGATAFFRYLSNGINDLVSNSWLSVFPNPAQDFFTITNAARCSVRIFDLTGALLREFSHGNVSGSYDISNLASGVYIVEVKTDSSSSRFSLLKN